MMRNPLRPTGSKCPNVFAEGGSTFIKGRYVMAGSETAEDLGLFLWRLFQNTQFFGF